MGTHAEAPCSSSISKNQIKFIKSLSLKKNRVKAQLFIAEGEKIVNEFGQSIPHCLPCTALISNSALNGDAIRTAMTKDQGGSFLHWIVAFPSQQQLSYSFCIVVYHTDKSPTLTVTAPGVRVMVVAYLPHLFLLLSRRTIMMN